MYYWDFINMKYVAPKVQEAMEDIFLILNKSWTYEDKKATDKMIRLFKESEDLLKETMDMKVCLDDTKRLLWGDGTKATPDKVLDIPEEPERLLIEINRMGGRSLNGAADTEQGQEKINILSVFLAQMAIYKFAKVYFPQILTASGTELNKKKISSMANFENDDIMEWEKGFWINARSGGQSVTAEAGWIFRCSNIFDKREGCRGQYNSFWGKKGYEYERTLQCINMAFEEDEETVKAVKEMQNGSFSSSDNKEYNGLKEIHDMKHVLDIMERSIKGELTEQDKTELRGNAQD